MTNNIKSILRRALSTFLSLFGITSVFTGCPMYGMPTVEYGCPTNNYIVEGSVTDSNGTPVKGIRIGAKKSPDDETLYSDYEFKPYSEREEVDEDTGNTYTKYEWSDYFDFVETDENGKYKIKWSLFPDRNRKFVLYAEDIDGEQNGSYSEKSVDIQFAESDRTEDGSWVDNYEIRNKNISLDSLK